MSDPGVVIDGGVLVGHDGSRTSGEAVQWAARHAPRLGVHLHILRAWVLTNAPRPPTLQIGYVPPLEDFQAAVLDRLRQDVDALGLPAECRVDLHAVHGQAASRLVETAEGAELVVVGRRGAGGFRGLLFGSTADQVVRHSPTPVVVVPTA
jgi:nucleotide-binding universal stress UspA family protein